MIEQLIKYIAPHQCIGCETEGTLWCAPCRTRYTLCDLRCYICRKLTPSGHALCRGCVGRSPFTTVFVATQYTEDPKKLIHLLKFERAKEAADIVARYMTEKIALPQLSLTIVPVPTATNRVRTRGYDQVALIARALARHTGYAYAPLLARQGQKRQVGQSREERKMQTGMSYRVTPRDLPKTQPILLVDDVITTGSTLEVAAAALTRNGFTQIDAAVFAAA